MEQFRVYIRVVGSKVVSEVDAIEHDGRVWIVPRWLDAGDGRTRRPERMIPLDRFEHDAIDLAHRRIRYAVTTPVAATLLTGALSEQFAREHGVLLSPDVSVPRPDPE